MSILHSKSQEMLKQILFVFLIITQCNDEFSIYV